MAFLLILITIAIIYRLGLLNPLLSPVSCASAPGFSCYNMFVNSTTGALSISLVQDTGSTIIVNGIACASAPNQNGTGPAYGNLYVTSNSAYYAAAYPVSGEPMYSGTEHAFTPLCYGTSGASSGSVGGLFFGYVWMNYTVPGYGKVVQKIATFTAKMV